MKHATMFRNLFKCIEMTKAVRTPTPPMIVQETEVRIPTDSESSDEDVPRIIHRNKTTPERSKK